ncbi:hypothetical protein A7X67_01730 [Clostridium sp. W14A]|nr:hypothetical protein A7X67_01730 [Clostridium sp. W14A]
MEWIYIIIEVILFFLLGLFIKNYFPSYMKEKGKDLATKEDIQEITRKTEEVQKEFKQKFELFSSDVHFKYDFYFKQYTMLYCKLYAIVIQSEYVRRFIKLNDGKDIPFDEAPFIEMSPTHRSSNKIEFGSSKPLTIEQKEEEIETPISKFNKEQLCDYIIENGEYASQKLLKLAVAYRFTYHFYAGNPDAKNASCQETANKEEFRLIREIVCCIVTEYNSLRKELKMDYTQDEFDTGIPKMQ